MMKEIEEKSHFSVPPLVVCVAGKTEMLNFRIKTFLTKFCWQDKTFGKQEF